MSTFLTAVGVFYLISLAILLAIIACAILCNLVARATQRFDERFAAAHSPVREAERILEQAGKR